MKQSESFHSDGFQNFDNEQQMKHRARLRHAKAVRYIPISETQEWMFSTDLDEAIDRLTSRLEVQSCH